MKKWFCFLEILVFLYLQQFQLSYSATVGLKSNLLIALPWVLINMLIVALPFMIGLFISKKIKWAMIFNIITITILSLINYHILLFHGSPFLAGDILSIPTALNVISEYNVVLDSIVFRLLGICFIEILVWYLVYFKLKNKNHIDLIFKRKHTLLLFLLNICCLFTLFFSPIAYFNKSLFSWSWGPAMNQYGYGVCFLNSMYVINNHYSEPENYNADSIVCEISDDISAVNSNGSPDIILILNETLANLDVYVDMKESQDLFSKINNIDGIISGYTVSSLIGGGTNNSEYELLTSNSMQVLTLSAPFLSLNMAESTSIVSYLNELNYTTVGMHCGNSVNYNRNNAYVDIGFDLIKLGKEDFNYYSKNGNRPWKDLDNYKDMIQTYESLDDNPRFMYLLTYQNHGGYEQNDDNLDIIKVNMTDHIT